MKTVKRVRYLSAAEACWYVGMDEAFITIFAKQGKVNMVGEKGDRYYELEGLNAIKDILADDAGETMIAAKQNVSLEIGQAQKEPALSSATVIACVGSSVICLVCVAIMLNFSGNEGQPRQLVPTSAGRSVVPESARKYLTNQAGHIRGRNSVNEPESQSAMNDSAR